MNTHLLQINQVVLEDFIRLNNLFSALLWRKITANNNPVNNVIFQQSLFLMWAEYVRLN